MVVKKAGIVLPYIEPPGSPIRLKAGTVEALSFKAIDDMFGDRAILPCSAGEMRSLQHVRYPQKEKRPSFEETRWAVLEASEASPEEETIVALFDLVTGHAKFRLALTRHFTTPFNAPAIPSLPPPPRYRLDAHLARKVDAGTTRLKGNRRLRIGLARWHSASRRQDPIESVLDCCSALEAVFGLQQELRLRLAFSVFDVVPAGKRRARALVYRLYGARNEFIHGSQIPTVVEDDRDALVSVTEVVLRMAVLGKIQHDGLERMLNG